MSSGAWCLLLCCAVVNALPFEQQPFQLRRPLPALASAERVSALAQFHPWHHWSGISPHFAPAPYAEAPPECNVDLAIYLTRHGAIYANDDEWDETMKPFVKYVKRLKAPQDKRSPFHFLNDFRSLINDDNLEEPTEPGLRDAKEVGATLRARYPDLFPPVESVYNVTTMGDPFKVWSASSTRDLATAKAFMTGAFPDLRTEDQRVTLIKVPNKQPDWATSLTPHKVCDKFEKESSQGPARKWLAVYAPRIVQRLNASFPGDLTNEHILAMQMLGAYEASITGIVENHWTRLFDKEDWLDFEYFFDIRYHYMVGYGNENLTAALGMPFVNTVQHLLETDITDPDHPHLVKDCEDKTGKPQKPERPPNATHTQLVYPYLTHREEPTTLAVALGLFNDTGRWEPPLDRRDDNRAWRTSEIIPFLGNIAFERLTCSRPVDDEVDTHVRVLVNHVAHRLPGCDDAHDGLSCSIARFKEWVQERNAIWGDFASACSK